MLLAAGAWAADRRLLSPTDLKSLDRENQLWSLVRPEDDVETNLTVWRRVGVSEEELRSFTPRLAALWDVEPPRAYGWLHAETVERIRDIDRAYAVRMRAARLYAATGMKAGRNPPETARNATLSWRRALWWHLEPRDYREFWMMNSPSAQGILRCARGIRLTDDEARTLCDWQREFDYIHGAMREPGFSGPRQWAEREEARWDMHRRFRTVLGDERFAMFLAESDEDFDAMQRALAPLEDINATAQLELWWLRRKDRLARRDVISSEQLDRIALATIAQAAELLGARGLASYQESEDGRWLRAPRRGFRPKIPIPPFEIQRSIPTG